MPTDSSLIDRLRRGPAALAAWCGLPDPSIHGLLAHESFDAIIMDMQHGAVDFVTALQAIPLVAAAGKPALVRLPVGDFSTGSRVLDAGASGVIAPMINTIEEARRFAGFMKFPPLGERSWGPYGSQILTGLEGGDYLRKANGLSVALAMVETREALNIIDDILAEPGIDGIFIGPSDLSIALSEGRSLDPTGAEVEKALDHALARTRAARKIAGVYSANGERAAELVRKGFDLVSVGGDAGMLRLGAQMTLAAARS